MGGCEVEACWVVGVEAFGFGVYGLGPSLSMDGLCTARACLVIGPARGLGKHAAYTRKSTIKNSSKLAEKIDRNLTLHKNKNKCKGIKTGTNKLHFCVQVRGNRTDD